MIANIFSSFVSVLVILWSPAVSATPAAIEIELSSGIEKIASRTEGSIVYFSFSELSQKLGARLDWITVGHAVRYSDDQHTIDFVVGSPYVKSEAENCNLVYPAKLVKGQLYLPELTFMPFLERLMPTTFAGISKKKGGKNRVSSGDYNVVDMEVSEKANGLLIELFLSDKMSYDVFITEGNWINISIRDGKINAPRIRTAAEKKHFYDAKVHQVEGAGQVSLWFKRPIKNWNHHLVKDPDRIQISIIDESFSNSDSSNSPVERRGLDELIDVIVVDAGHGGNDYGAIGDKGTREKDVALSIARYLARLIRKDKKFKVVMTRDEDKTMTLENRADIANRAKADLFISIHANANPKPSVRGWNVFFLAPAKNDSARVTAQFENSVFLREIAEPETNGKDKPEMDNADPVLGILNEMLMTEFQTESHEFALMCDKSMRKKVKIPARGVDQAGFFVLNKVYSPSVLVETGFISNPVEEKLLKSSDYQQNMAEAIYEAVKKFADMYSKK
jgi:N-acetylmuramoyl-L-alanine amidase